MIVWGMWVQAVGIFLIAGVNVFSLFALGSFLLGAGTAMVYPTMLAAIGDVAGVTADAFGVTSAVWLVGIITFLSGLIVAFRMEETMKKALLTVGIISISKTTVLIKYSKFKELPVY